jgi:endo-1,4-beta-mannosidase
MRKPRLTLFVCAVLLSTSCGGPEPAVGVSSQVNKQAHALTHNQGFLSRKGQQFYLNGAPTRLLGVNRYQLGGGPGAAQCQQRSSMRDLADYQDRFIREAAAHGAGLIRMWAFQNFAGPSGTDFSALDQAVATARRHGVRLILTLENTWGDCSKPSGKPKDAAWFTDGYRHPYGYALDFPSYVQHIVSHYKDEPTIAMWQIINEGKLYQNPKVMRDFMVHIARQIKSIDRNHLVSSGGAIQCWQGAQGAADFASYYNDDAIDVLDAHDYDADTVPWSSCMESALQAANHLNKPLLIGESGIDTAKHSADERAKLLAAKMHAAAGRKVAGYLIWSLSLDPTRDGFDFHPGDPTSNAFKHAGAEWNDRR